MMQGRRCARHDMRCFGNRRAMMGDTQVGGGSLPSYRRLRSPRAGQLAGRFAVASLQQERQMRTPERIAAESSTILASRRRRMAAHQTEKSSSSAAASAAAGSCRPAGSGSRRQHRYCCAGYYHPS